MKRDTIRIHRQGHNSTFKWMLLTATAALLLSGCSSIWNASDLVVWVKDQAAKEGCQRESIELKEWYSKTDSGNVWRGTCLDDNNNPMSFGINVDSVWKPSAE